MRALPDLSVYLVLDPDLCAGIGMVETAREAVAAGAGAIQLRDKGATTVSRIALGQALMTALDGTGAVLIVNDDIEAALAIGAHGLHVGQDDLTAREARERLGPRPFLGVSVETVETARAIDPTLVDYTGCGPVFATPTKTDHKTPVGFDGLTRLVAASPVPAVAIGGLKALHAQAALETGIVGLAVVSAICGQADPGAATRTLVQSIAAART